MCQYLIDNPQALVDTAVEAVSGHYSDYVTDYTRWQETDFKTVMFTGKAKSNLDYVNNYTNE